MTKGRPKPDKRVLDTVLLMLKDGMNYSEIARSLGRSKQLIRYWVKVYPQLRIYTKDK